MKHSFIFQYKGSQLQRCCAITLENRNVNNIYNFHKALKYYVVTAALRAINSFVSNKVNSKKFTAQVGFPLLVLLESAYKLHRE